MKKRFFTIALLSLFLLPKAFSLEIGGNFLFGNLYFETDRTADSTAYPAMTSMNYGGDFYLKHSFQEGMSLEARYKYDPVLRSALYTQFFYHTDYISMGFGPYFGLFNNIQSLSDILDFEKTIRAGISTSFRFQYPGIIFFDLGADSTLGGNTFDVNNYNQERILFALGFFVPNAIISFELELKNYTQVNAGNILLDSQSGYYFKSDIYKKNIPVRLDLTIGYEKLSRSWGTSGSVTTTHDIHSVIFGTDFKIDATEYLMLDLNFVNTIYTMGMNDTTILVKETLEENQVHYQFRLSVGFNLDLDYFTQKKLIMDDNEARAIQD